MGSIFSVRNVEIDDRVIKLSPINQNKKIKNYEQDNVDIEENVNSKNKKLEETILKEARIKAKEIIIEAEKEADKIKYETINKSKEEGYKQGYKEGIKTGTSDIYTKYKGMIKQSNDEINNIIKHRENVFVDIEKQAIDLALLIARKILNYEINNNDEVMNGILDKVVEEYVKKGNEKIYVSMKNKYILTENNERLNKMFDNEISLNIIDSKDIHDTECFVENEKGKLDISIEAQFKQISSVLTNSINCC